ncbi:MAG: cellulase family glycosylhydrolase [Patescibacteria group bacterium]|nr:cellulase family glycosylhydrolase [Patescibacteria group bacterium]
MKDFDIRIRYTFIMLLTVVGCFLTSGAHAADIGQFVSVSGTRLTLNNQTWMPVGMNLMDHETIWDTNKTEPTLTWLRDKDFADLEKSGFNSVRLVVKSDYFQDVDPPHKFSEAGFKWLDAVIALAKKHNIKLILDMHMPTGGVQQDYQINDDNQAFWNDDWAKGRFVDVWREIARRYAKDPTVWAYDTMNEPATTDFKAYQNLMRSAINSIRLYDDSHVIMLQKGMKINNDGSWSVEYPQTDDANIVRSIHFYQPTDFTLQGAAWLNSPTSSSREGNPTMDAAISYNHSSTTELNLLTQDLQTIVDKAQSSTHAVVLTEFGLLWPKKLTGQPDWIVDVAKLASNFGIGWHYWHYTGTTCSQSFNLKTLYGTCHPLTFGMLSGAAK